MFGPQKLVFNPHKVQHTEQPITNQTGGSWESKEYYGVQQCLTSSNNLEKEYLQGMAARWKEEVRTGHLGKRDMWDDLTLWVMKK